MKRLILVLAVLCLASSARGQHWTKVKTPLDGQTGYVIETYFLSETYGFVYSNPSFSLFRTTDGGDSWKQITPPESLAQYSNEIYFVNPAHGFIILQGQFGIDPATIYETRDSANSWKRIPLRDYHVYSLYATDSAIFVNACTDYLCEREVFFCTRDDGSTWDSIVTSTFYSGWFGIGLGDVRGNRDSLIVNRYQDSVGNSYLLYSTNAGIHWVSLELPHGAYDFKCIPHESCVLAIDRSEEPTKDVFSVRRSSPPFDNWESILRAEIGTPEVSSCAIYAANARDTSGLLRTTDMGLTWTAVGGPNYNEFDEESLNYMSVVGHGQVVFASTLHGLWKTTDGGDGRLSAAPLLPRFYLSHNHTQTGTDTLEYVHCLSDSFEVYNQNISCAYAKFDSISIGGLDPSEYSVVSTHHCGCQRVTDTSLVVVVPNGIGPRHLIVHYHFTDGEFNQIDTSIRITLVARVSNAALIAKTPLVFANLPACAILDTTISFYNQNPCDTIVVKRVQFSGLQSVVSESPLPDTLPPNGSLRIKVVSTPTDSSGDQASIHVVGLGYDSIFKIHVIRESLAKMNPAAFDFGTLSTCAVATVQTTFFNNSCDSIEITSIDPAFDARFSYGPISLPLWVRSLDSVLIPIAFSSRTPSLLHDSLTVHLLSASGKAATSTIQLSARALASGFVLGFLPDTTFSTILPCDALDTTFHLVNKNQCDTIIVSSIKGSTSLNPFAEGNLPDSIPPGGSLGVRISISSKDTNGERFSVEVLGPGYDSVFHFQLFRGAPPNVLLYLGAASRTVQSGDTIDIPVYLSGNVTLSGATSLSLPFALDTNVLRVLSFNPAVSGITVGSLSYSKGISTVPLQASDLTVNGETLIGTLRCIVYLADTLQTSVSLAGATLSSEDSRCVSLSLQTNAVSIALTGCGDSTFLKFMKNGTFEPAIASIAPNPVTSSLLVRWNGGSGVTYDITDALGILRDHNSSMSSQSEIDVRSWPSGVYYIRARGASGMISTRRFVVAK